MNEGTIKNQGHFAGRRVLPTFLSLFFTWHQTEAKDGDEAVELHSRVTLQIPVVHGADSHQFWGGDLLPPKMD